MSSEAANNAVACQAPLPTMALASPDGAIKAVMLATSTFSGIAPRPQAGRRQSNTDYSHIRGLFLINLLLLPLEWFCQGFWPRSGEAKRL